MSDDQIEVAASRALEQISSSAHARSQPATPSTNTLPNINFNQTDILDIFMSPDKPKSRLRQLAENSAKKYSVRSSLPAQPSTNNTPSSPPGFMLNLGIPTKPPIDPKAFAFKPPSRRSLGPRRSSIVSRKSLSPSKSPKPSIENLLDDLDIIDRPKPPSDKKSSRNSDTKTKLKETTQQSHSRSSSNPPATRKSRRVTIVHLSTQQTTLETIKDSKEDLTASTHQSERVTRDTMNECNTLDPRVEDDESSISNDSFDPNVLLAQKPEISLKSEESEQAEIKKEHDEDDSIIFHPRRTSRRNPSILSSKRVILDSDSEDDHKSRPSTPSNKLPLSYNSRILANRSHNRKTSLKANHSKQKSPNPTLIDADVTSSDDSIEILPSRALQFHKSRALAISTLSNDVPKGYPSFQLKPDEIKAVPRDHLDDAPSSIEEEIKIKRQESVESLSYDSHKSIGTAGNFIKNPSKINDNIQSKPTIPEPMKKITSTKKTRVTKKKPIAFVKIRDDLAEELIECLDEKVFNGRLPEELELVWNKRLNTTAGRAKWSTIKDPKGNILKEKVSIELATKVIDDEVKLRNTLAHELCHVACWFIDRQKDEQHGKYFKAWAKKINLIMPDVKVTTKHNYAISYKFNWGCNQPECTKVYGRHSNSIDPERHGCVCGGRLVRIRKTSSKAGVDKPASSTTSDVPQQPEQNLISFGEDLTDRLKDLKFTLDLIEL